MKTILPQVIKTAEDANKLFTDLLANGEFYHPEDEASSIICAETNLPLFTLDESRKLNALMDEAFTVCDVWELPSIVNFLNEMYETHHH